MNIGKPKYYDAAATTPCDPRVVEAMLPYFSEIFGNASSNHIYGKQAKLAVDKARTQVAEIINAEESEIYFTSGSTEGINWVLKGYLDANPEKGNHIITVKTEHKAVLNTCAYLEEKGYEVTYLDVDSNGIINLDELKAAIKKNTALICVMYVNNEIGIIQDIQSIGKIARENDVVFFTDATQAVGKVPVDVTEDNIDILCLSGHKMKGPKGIGAVYLSNGTKLTPLIHGGGQEKGLRAGTYNTPLIVGLGKACVLARKEYTENIKSWEEKRKELTDHFAKNNIGAVNFTNVPSAPHILSISLTSNEAEEFLVLNCKDFVASTGSACNSNLIQISHVLGSIKVINDKTIRLSLI